MALVRWNVLLGLEIEGTFIALALHRKKLRKITQNKQHWIGNNSRDLHFYGGEVLCTRGGMCLDCCY